MPRVSVLMPIYNAGKYLADAINSILEQTFSDWELIIADDGSTDNSKDIIDSYRDNRIKYIKNDSNRGIIYTRNRLTQEAIGEYIALMDGDDISSPKRLEMQVAFLDNNPDYGLCGTFGEVIDSNGKKTGNIKLSENHEEIKCALLFSNTFIQSSIMGHRVIFIQNPYDKNFPVVGDYELWSRLVNITKIKNLPYSLVKYRWHQSNVSNSKKELARQLTQTVFYKQLTNLNIKPKQDELDIHFALRNKEFIPESSYSSFFKDSRKWLKKLSKTNQSRKLYDPDLFNATICFRWIFACKEQHNKLEIINLPIIPGLKSQIQLLGMLYGRI